MFAIWYGLGLAAYLIYKVYQEYMGIYPTEYCFEIIAPSEIKLFAVFVALGGISLVLVVLTIIYTTFFYKK